MDDSHKLCAGLDVWQATSRAAYVAGHLQGCMCSRPPAGLHMGQATSRAAYVAGHVQGCMFGRPCARLDVWQAMCRAGCVAGHLQGCMRGRPPAGLHVWQAMCRAGCVAGHLQGCVRGRPPAGLHAWQAVCRATRVCIRCMNQIFSYWRISGKCDPPNTVDKYGSGAHSQKHVCLDRKTDTNIPIELSMGFGASASGGGTCSVMSTLTEHASCRRIGAA